MFAKIMSIYRGEESLGETFWLWLVCPVVLIFGSAELLWSNSIALFELSYRVRGISILGVQPDNILSNASAILRVPLVALVFFSGVGVVRSARAASSRVLALVTTASVILLCGFVSAAVLRDEFRGGLVSDGSLASIVKGMDAQLPQPMGEWASWERLSYADQMLSARFELDRSKIDRIDPEKLREDFIGLACRQWKNHLSDTDVRRFEGNFYSGTTLFQTISITRSDCP